MVISHEPGNDSVAKPPRIPGSFTDFTVYVSLTPDSRNVPRTARNFIKYKKVLFLLISIHATCQSFP